MLNTLNPNNIYNFIYTSTNTLCQNVKDISQASTAYIQGSVAENLTGIAQITQASLHLVNQKKIELQDKTSTIIKRCGLIQKSTLGQCAISGLKENFAEYFGYYAGAIPTSFIAPSLNKGMSSAGTFLYENLKISLANPVINSTHIAINYIAKTAKIFTTPHATFLEKNSRFNLIHKINFIAYSFMIGAINKTQDFSDALAFISPVPSELIGKSIVITDNAVDFFITISTIFHNTLSQASSYAPEMGELFTSISSQSIGILAGHTAMRMTGSQEKLWDNQDPLNTYVVKSLQSIVASMIFNSIWYSDDSTYIKPILELALGSISYNIIDIYNLSHKIIHKEFIADLLPSISSEKIIKQDFLVDAFSGYLSDSSLKKIKDLEKPIINTIAMHIFPSKNTASQTLKKAAIVSIQKISPVGQALNFLLESQVKELSKQIIIELEKESNGIKLSCDLLFTSFVNSINEYTSWYNRQEISDLTSAHFNSWLNWSKSISILDKTTTSNILQDTREKLQSKLSFNFSSDYPLTPLDDISIKNKAIDTLHIPESIAENIFANVNSISMIQKAISSHHNTIAQEAIQFMQSKETELFGWTVTDNQNKEYVKDLVDMHLPLILNLTIRKICIEQKRSLEEKEMNDFYINALNGLCTHYSMNGGKILSIPMRSFIQHQMAVPETSSA